MFSRQAGVRTVPVPTPGCDPHTWLPVTRQMRAPRAGGPGLTVITRGESP